MAPTALEKKHPSTYKRNRLVLGLKEIKSHEDWGRFIFVSQRPYHWHEACGGSNEINRNSEGDLPRLVLLFLLRDTKSHGEFVRLFVPFDDEGLRLWIPSTL